MNLESVAIFSKGNLHPTIAVFSVPKDGIVDYFLNARSTKECHVKFIVVGKGRDGKLYHTLKEMLVVNSSHLECPPKLENSCEQSNNPLDKVICSNFDLEILDQELQTYYNKLMKRDDLHASRKLLLQQDQWLKERTQHCKSLDTKCLLDYYQKRLSSLKEKYTIKPIPYELKREPCNFKKIEFPKDTLVFAGGSYQGNNTSFQIDKSGNIAGQFDVIVNSPDKPVALILGAYNPSIWNIQWTKGTKIVAATAFGHHRQVIAGLPTNIPTLAGNNGSSCYKGDSFWAYVDNIDDNMKRFNNTSNRLYKKDIFSIKKAEKGSLVFGKPISSTAKLFTSKTSSPESFSNLTFPLAGGKGVQQLLKKKMIRTATKQDLDRWEIQKQNAFIKTLEVLNQGLPPVVKWEDQGNKSLNIINKELPKLIDVKPTYAFKPFTGLEVYVIKEKITIPKGLYGGHSVTFFLDKGVPYPDGDLAHSILYDFNTMTCNGHGCSSRIPKIEQKIDLYSECKFKEFNLSENIQIYAGASPYQKELGYTIDDSGKGAKQLEVVVNSPTKPVALLLHSRGPSIWNIKWTEGTKIEAVFTTGRYRQVITGLPKDTPIDSRTHSDRDYKCYLSSMSYRIRNLQKINPFSNKIFGGNVTKVYTNSYNGILIMGDEVSKFTKLYTSNDTVPESFSTSHFPNSGQTGINYLMQNGMIRKATIDDMREPSKFYNDTIHIHNTYVILKKITIPAGLYGGNSVDFILEKGVPLPNGKLGHARLYDLSTGKGFFTLPLQ